MCDGTFTIASTHLAGCAWHHLQPGTQTPPQAEVTYKLGGPQCALRVQRLRPAARLAGVSAIKRDAEQSSSGYLEALRGSAPKQVQVNLAHPPHHHHHPRAQRPGSWPNQPGQSHTPRKGDGPWGPPPDLGARSQHTSVLIYDPSALCPAGRALHNALNSGSGPPHAGPHDCAARPGKERPPGSGRAGARPG